MSNSKILPSIRFEEKISEEKTICEKDTSLDMISDALSNTREVKNNVLSKGVIIVLSSPSGGGKSSLVKALIKDDPTLAVSVSVTTRKPRSGEVEGLHYIFKTREEFLAMIKNDELLEYSEVYGNFYGIPAKFVYDRIENGQDIIFDIDFQGAYKLKKSLKDKTVNVFILPPSIEVLLSRLKLRSQDSAEEIERRVALAESEIKHAKNYGYVLINEDFDLTLQKLKEIIKVAKEKKHRSK